MHSMHFKSLSKHGFFLFIIDDTSSCSLVGWFWCLCLVQPVKIIDPHLVSSFFDNYKRVYLHATTELENRSSFTAECSLSIHVTTELEGSIHLVEQLQTQNVSVPARSRVQYTFPEVSGNIYSAQDLNPLSVCVWLLKHLKNLFINSRYLYQQIPYWVKNYFLIAFCLGIFIICWHCELWLFLDCFCTSFSVWLMSHFLNFFP